MNDEQAFDISLVCVTYNSVDLVAIALRSAVAASSRAGLRIELIVVDNASSDGTADAVATTFPGAIVIRNPANVGFGVANNQAFAVSQGRWWLLLNPDASLDQDALERLVEAMATDPRLAMVGPSVGGAGMGGAESAGMLPGIRSLAGHFLFLNRLLPPERGGAWRGFQVRPRPGARTQEVEWVSGAAALLRPEAVRPIGGFDPSIFMYGEDLDLCARLLDRGWRLSLVPAAHAMHTIGGSQRPESTRWLDGLQGFLVRRRVSGWRRAIEFAIVAVGLTLRAAAASVHPGDDAQRSHRRRMRAGALRAARLAVGGAAAAGRESPS